MRLSQGQLNVLERCPRQFQHTYLEQLGSPTNLEQQERLSSGSRFHLLMQQRELGLPIEPLVTEDAQLQSWMNAFADAASEILSPQRNTFRESEHCRTLQVEKHLLTVIYDLLIASDRACQILDWKTYPKPQNRSKLGQNWQTLLYLYVLAETSEYLLEQISMTYWFVQSDDKPQSLTFTYNNTHHQQTEQKLNRLLTQLSKWLEAYERGEPFPQVPEGSRKCEYCQFVTRCDRDRYDKEESINQNWLSNLADVQELSL